MNVEITYDNALLTKNQHDSMKAWHANMATQHAIASEWHSDQSERLSKAIQNLPLDPEKIVTSLGAEKGGSTGEPSSSVFPSSAPESGTEVRATPASGSSTAQTGGSAPRAIEVPLDPVKKADLLEILNQHIDQFGSFDKSVEDIVGIILGK
jgi:hypothetical protein